MKVSELVALLGKDASKHFETNVEKIEVDRETSKVKIVVANEVGNAGTPTVPSAKP